MVKELYHAVNVLLLDILSLYILFSFVETMPQRALKGTHGMH